MEIPDILTRGVANIIPSKEQLKTLLEGDRKLNIYMGIDPTAVNIHLGHAVVLRKLQALADLGHNVTFLVGSFTAKIGDTSDKETERPQLTDEEIEQNLKTYKEQAEKILDFSKITVVFNAEWLSTLTFEDVVKLTRHFSLNDFISRELIKKRLTDGKSVGLLETMYPLMQGYDSYHLDTDIQLGGTDQTFNMQAGRTLVKDLRHKESFIITNEFLSGTDGRKMSKTWGNAIWLTDSETDMYGKVMSLKDDLIIEYFTLATNLSLSEIDQIKEELSKTQNPMEIKKRLAYEITKQFHGEEGAQKGQTAFENTVQNKQAPEEMEEINIKDGFPLSKFLLESNLIPSMGEWKRLIEQHGVSINEEKIDNPFVQANTIQNDAILKIGKRLYVRIKK